jgi:predicted phosphoribosyltransferase
MFKNRKDAALKLVDRLLDLKNNPNCVVVALPRGGVVLGVVLAKELNLKFDIFFVKKIPSPFNSEVAIGAVSENGFVYLNESAIKALGISSEYLKNKELEILQKIKEKRELYNKKRVSLKDKTVILVDDGIATGASVILAIEALKKEGAKEAIVAAPVAPLDVANYLEQITRCEILIKDSNFMAVGAYYEDFSQLSDIEVINFLNLF